VDELPGQEIFIGALTVIVIGVQVAVLPQPSVTIHLIVVTPIPNVAPFNDEGDIGVTGPDDVNESVGVPVEQPGSLETGIGSKASFAGCVYVLFPLVKQIVTLPLQVIPGAKVFSSLATTGFFTTRIRGAFFLLVALSLAVVFCGENIFLKKLFGTVCPTIKTPKPIMNNAIRTFFLL
jgi:hypothetical protein